MARCYGSLFCRPFQVPRPSLAESKNSFELSPIYTTPLSIEGMIAFVPRLIMQLSGARWGRQNGHVSSRARF